MGFPKAHLIFHRGGERTPDNRAATQPRGASGQGYHNPEVQRSSLEPRPTSRNVFPSTHSSIGSAVTIQGVENAQRAVNSGQDYRNELIIPPTQHHNNHHNYEDRQARRVNGPTRYPQEQNSPVVGRERSTRNSGVPSRLPSGYGHVQAGTWNQLLGGNPTRKAPLTPHSGFHSQQNQISAGNETQGPRFIRKIWGLRSVLRVNPAILKKSRPARRARAKAAADLKKEREGNGSPHKNTPIPPHTPDRNQEEAKKYQKRRMANRVAVQKCRSNTKERFKNLEKEQGRLEKENKILLALERDLQSIVEEYGLRKPVENGRNNPDPSGSGQLAPLITDGPDSRNNELE